MSLTSQMQPFNLQEIIKTKDSLGCDQISYKDVKIIQVSINKVHRTNINQDGLNVYIATYTGLTQEQLEDKQYRLYSPQVSYDIKSFINGRWTTMQLEVI